MFNHVSDWLDCLISLPSRIRRYLTLGISEQNDDGVHVQPSGIRFLQRLI